jgi:hypothetical protein
MKKWTPFRKWVHDLWQENCEEHRIYGEDPLLQHEYWNKYKYWLKREYQHKLKVNHDK